MIRPITVICWILALGAGLYLYRAKHEVELMDKHIEQIAKETNDIRAESRHFLDEWIRLGEPEQLRKYSDQYLGLKAVMPTQFVRLSDLPGRLPTPRADPVEGTVEATAQPETSPTAQAQTSDAADEAAADELPVPPIPPAPTVLTSVTLPTVTAPGITPPGVTPASGIAPPLQARPVTPRLTVSGQQDLSAPKPHPATAADEPRAIAARPVVAGQPNGQPNGQPVRPAQGLAPLQAQNGPRQGLPPLQAQGPPPSQGQGAPDTRQAQVQVPAQMAPRGLAKSPYPPPAPAVSLLGGSRGAVPLPLPAPMPVSATWPGANR